MTASRLRLRKCCQHIHLISYLCSDQNYRPCSETSLKLQQKCPQLTFCGNSSNCSFKPWTHLPRTWGCQVWLSSSAVLNRIPLAHQIGSRPFTSEGSSIIPQWWKNIQGDAIIAHFTMATWCFLKRILMSSFRSLYHISSIFNLSKSMY